MDKLFTFFESNTPLLVAVDKNEKEVLQVVQTIISHADQGVTISNDLESVSNELLHRSDGKSSDTNYIIALTVINEEDAGAMDFVHLDNIATQGEQYNVGAVVGLISNKTPSELLSSTSSMKKFALKKATIMESDYVLTYLSD